MEDIDRKKKKKQRWSVTYTKHIKQKRKIYQDGFLDLHFSTNKVMLFDECEKLLECRILKDEEVVSSGETLTFNAFLVDVGDPEVGVDNNSPNKLPVSDLNFHGRDKKITKKIGFMRRQKFINPSISSSGGEDNNVETNEARPHCLSTSRKIIKEIRQSEQQRYGVPESSPDLSKSATEWQVLYTTQMTQKTKKYHDGFLRLARCESLGTQIMLYDASKRQLDRRFLKKNEIISSGESISFDAHLVDIGEPEGENQLLPDLNIQGNNYNHASKPGIMHGQSDGIKDNKSVAKEWCVLYTSDITQKAKKYHSGILRLASCGSYRKQVTLLNECKTFMTSKFLSLSEDVKVGSMLALPKYLVEVGELLMSSEGKYQNTYLREDANSRSISIEDRTKFCNAVPTNKTLRNACQILSILQKPAVQGSVAAQCIDKSINASTLFEDSELSRQSCPHEGPSQNLDVGGPSKIADTEISADLNFSKGLSTFSGNQYSNDTEAAENCYQCHPTNVEADTKCCDEAFSSGISSLMGSCTHSPNDDRRKTLDQSKSARKMDIWPTFDLGF
ncbi:ZINC FINGER GRF-TYPE CONTAINING 1 [Salix viminalis]|uniref:ZINC FINGER GRF-TYPE CONTAINING 1 n=1 Tax=Salix viminalis TaxID=40686 RepID=A0A9Q0SI44_SALVM|nr:ZINC FINGER GRF-TYPE CONTAINING 1 [Salix viminalis]